MSFPATFSADDITKCRGDYAGAQFLSLVPNTVVLKAQITGILAVGTSIFAVYLDTPISGAFANAKAGQRVLMGTANDIRLATIPNGRVRKAMAGSTFYLNETSLPIAVGDYLWVIDDYVITDKLSIESFGLQYKDYDITYRGLDPLVYNVPTAVVGRVSGSPATYIYAFSPSAYPAEVGATISSYLWTTPDGAVVSGSLSAAAVTIAFPEGFRWVHLTVTDSGGRTKTRHIQVHAHGSTYTPSLDWTGAQLNHSIDNGQSITATAWDGVNDVLDGTSCVGWTREWHNDVEGSLVSNVKFVGRLRQVSANSKADLVYNNVQEVQWQIESPTAQLARTESLSRAIIPKASPSVWDEIKSLTVWKAIVYLLDEHSTFLDFHDLTFNGYDLTYAIPQVGIQKGDLFRAVTDLASSINAVWEFAPDGTTRIGRDLRYETTANRSAATTVYEFDNRDWIDLTINIDPPHTTAKVDASGATYSLGSEISVLGLAPGAAQLVGTEEVPLTKQYLTAELTKAQAQTEIIQRAADRLAIELKRITITAAFPDNYNWLTPSLTDWYTFIILTTDNKRGLTFDTNTRWLCTAVSQAWDNNTGTCAVQATFTIETQGSGGMAIEYPTQTEEPVTLPDIPTFDPYEPLFPMPPDLIYGDDPLPEDDIPSTGDTIKTDGSAQIFIDETGQRVFVTLNGLAISPAYTDITPPFAANEAPKHVCFDPFSVAPIIGAYVLTSDDVDSWVWYADNVFAADPGWTQGSSRTGVYEVLRAGSAAGSVYITNPNADPTVVTGDFNKRINFDSSDDLNYEIVGGSIAGGILTGTYDGYWTSVMLKVSFAAPTVVTYILAQYSQPASPYGIYHRGSFYDIDGNYLGDAGSGLTDHGGPDWIYLGVTAGGYHPNTGSVVFGFQHWGSEGPLRLDYVDIQGSGSIYVGGGTMVAYSADYGATWDEQALTGHGSAVDTQHSGENSYVAADNITFRSDVQPPTDYTAWYTATGDAQVKMAIIPYFDWDGTSQMDTANPDVVLGFNVPDGSSRTLVEVEGGATPGTEHDITPVAGFAFDNADAFTCLYHHHYACFGKDGGIYHLYTSSNQGSTWIDRGALTAPTFLRCRRGDNSAATSGTNRGQLFMLDSGVLKYSSNWGVTLISRTPPGTCTKMDIWG